MRPTCETVIAGKSIWICCLVVQMNPRCRQLDRMQPTPERLIVPGMLSIIGRDQLQSTSAIGKKKYAGRIVEVPGKIGHQGPKWKGFDRRLLASNSTPLGFDDDGTRQLQPDLGEISFSLSRQPLQDGGRVIVHRDAVIAASSSTLGQRAARKLALEFAGFHASAPQTFPQGCLRMPECRQPIGGRAGVVRHVLFRPADRLRGRN